MVAHGLGCKLQAASNCRCAKATRSMQPVAFVDFFQTTVHAGKRGDIGGQCVLTSYSEFCRVQTVDADATIKSGAPDAHFQYDAQIEQSRFFFTGQIDLPLQKPHKFITNVRLSCKAHLLLIFHEVVSSPPDCFCWQALGQFVSATKQPGFALFQIH